MLARVRQAVLTSAAIAMFALTGAACDVNKFEICPDCDDNPADAGGPVFDAGATVDGDPTVDASMPTDACVSFAPEECDGLDNDCDGLIDEGVLPGIGAACSNNTGECTEGVTVCTEGEIACTGQLPNIEICDDKDNDCNGMVDDGNPEGDVPCGSAVGECVVGLTECQAGGNLACVGSVEAVPEICDGLDNDCNNMFDDGVATGGDCGPAEGNTGECQLGTLTCLGGAMQCVGAVHPQPEQCDGTPDTVDHDCNGDTLLPNFNLDNNRQHCGACNNECLDNFTVMTPHINQVTCNTGVCTIPAIGGCEPGYHDINGVYEDGCEYACVIQSTEEICNQQDDDCDGLTDEMLSPPDICSANGECANPSKLVADCTPTGWQCDYAGQRPNVEVDGMGNIVPETLCDGLDNDCDTAVDEGDPTKNQACADNGVGICQGTGTFRCVPGDATAPVECNITTAGQVMGTEACNNLDDDCDGTTDEDPDTGELTQWVDIGSGVEIFAYEASRPAAAPGDNGTGSPNISGKACSEPNRLPWTTVKYADAQAACTALGGGARLCTEAEWERACRGPMPTTITQDSGGDQLIVIEAEDFDFNVGGTENDVWTLETADTGFSGTGYMSTETNNDGDSNSAGNSISQSPRLDFNVDFTFVGANVVHRVCMRSWAPNSNGNRAHVGTGVTAGTANTGTIPGSADDFGSFASNAWTWQCTDDGNNDRTLTIAAPGIQPISIWMREDGIRVDKIILTTNLSYTPTGKGPSVGCEWSYSSSCRSYAATTCNGNDLDTDGATPGDQDDLRDTGAMAMCFTDWTGGNEIHDMSGNVKEWTEARSAAVNPIRGGASNNTEVGISCGFDFTAADDNFFFPNVGFRCCR